MAPSSKCVINTIITHLETSAKFKESRCFLEFLDSAGGELKDPLGDMLTLS